MANKPFEPLMKLTGLLLLAIILLGCDTISPEEKAKDVNPIKPPIIYNPNTNLPETEKRNIFKQLTPDIPFLSFHIAEKQHPFYKFYHEYYSNNIGGYNNYGLTTIDYYCMNEEIIDPEKADLSRTWFRCLFVPPYGYTPYFITMQKQDENYILNTKLPNDTFNLKQSYAYHYPMGESTELFDKDKAVIFFNMVNASGITTDTTKPLNCGGMDGTSYDIEVILNGKYTHKKIPNGHCNGNQYRTLKEVIELLVYNSSAVKNSTK